MSNRRITTRPLTTAVVRGRMHRWRSGDRSMPCQVASPQSLTPFPPAVLAYRSCLVAATIARRLPDGLTKRRSGCDEGCSDHLHTHTERRHESRSTVYQPVAVG